MRAGKYLNIAALVMGFAAAAQAQEGHPGWWWDLKSTDMIVEGTIKYDSSKYYEINPVNVAGSEKKYYWIVGSLRIERILFINKDARHIESYRQYIKEKDAEHKVLIAAFRRHVLFSHGAQPDRTQLDPILGLDIPKDRTIFNLSQIFVFPVLSLNLESVVPVNDQREAMQLIEKRTNNLLTIK